MVGKPLFKIEIGEPNYEYKSVKGINSYILADTRIHTVLKREYPEYYNLQEFKAKQRFYRVHLPITLTPNFGNLPKTVDLSYSFSFNSIYKERTGKSTSIKKTPIHFPFKWEKVPISSGGRTEWFLTSEWMVESDKEIWNNGKLLVETSLGKLKIANQPGKNDRWSTPLVNLYFPFSINYWAEQNGFNGRWTDENFPEFVYREVEGNEVFESCNVQVFTSNSDSPSCGTLDEKELNKLFNKLKNKWENPYKSKYVYTNLWKISSWAAKYKKIVEPKLKAAFLSRICLEFPNDSDAAELLLKQLAINKDSEKGGRIYVKCKKKWPKWSEYWFKIYLSSVKDEPTRRALLMSFLREHPSSGFALNKLSCSLIKDERIGPAKRLTDKWESIEPSNIYVYSSQAKIAKLEDNEDKLRLAYSQAIRFALPVKTNISFQGSGYNLYVQGCNLLKAGDTEKALRYFRKTLTVTNFAACYLRMGDTYLKIGLTASAIKSYKKALSLSPNHPGALSGIIRSYNKVKGSHSEKPYQKKLVNVISPLVKEEISKKNWTNTVALAKYVLDVYPESQFMQEIYIRSLIHLRLYDKASEKLYKTTGNGKFEIQINALWGELSTAIYRDKSVLILSKNKISWLKLAIDAWRKVSKLSPKYSVPYLEQALLNLEMGNYSKAYLALKKCYKKNPSPELAVWIGGICVQMADENHNMTLPDNSSKTFAAEAMDFYNKANESADTKFFSPETGIGLFRAAKHESKSGADYTTYLRKALRVFPASPEVRAAQIKNFTDADATAPLLWVPYTNVLESLRPSNYDIMTCLERLYTLREIDVSRTLTRKALNEIFWADILFADINNKREITSKPKIYTIESKAGFRFVLKKRIFAQPVGSYEWFSLRSKYSAADLKTGKTLWWQKKQLISDAYKKLKDAFDSIDNKTGKVAICHAAVKRDYGYEYMFGETKPSTVYSRELQRIFFIPATATPKRHSRGYYNSPAEILKSRRIDVPPTSDLISEITFPCKNSGSSAFSPFRRRYYFSENVTEKLLPGFLQDFLPAISESNIFSRVKVNNFSLLVDSDFKILWNKKTPRERDSSCELNNEKVIIHQAPEKKSSSWKGTGFIPLISKNEIPRIDSFFNRALTGRIQGINIATAHLKTDNPPVLSFVFSPSPAYKSYKDWNDENITIEIEWRDSSNAVLRVFTKSYQIKNGILPNDPGIKIGEKNIITPIDLEIKIYKSKINIIARSVGATNKVKSVIVGRCKLSEFAWRSGVYFSIQSKACDFPIDYEVGDFYFSD